MSHHHNRYNPIQRNDIERKRFRQSRCVRTMEDSNTKFNSHLPSATTFHHQPPPSPTLRTRASLCRAYLPACRPPWTDYNSLPVPSWAVGIPARSVGNTGDRSNAGSDTTMQCSQPSGGPAGPSGGTAKSPGRDGTVSCSPSRPR